MRDQLKLLEELQRHDAELLELEALCKTLPDRVQKVESAIAELDRLLEEKRLQLQDTEAFRSEQEQEKKDAADQLSKAKAKSSAVRNLKEQNAVQRELETTRRQIEQREEEIGKLTQAINEQKAKIAEHESRVGEQRKELAAEQDRVQKRIADMQAKLQAAKAERDDLAKKLRPDVLKKYSAIRMKRGLAIVAVHDGTCRGCNMRIPPQLYNIIQRGASLEICPNCNRMIYWAKLLEEVAETA
ncbi:MAG TPA: C4-type zinc ribbon domain-containing protein [Pseudomonadota bacterium]|nr:C4-type zinc ribbon domain-containing protein [Pseudomonadota bacterium]HNK45213.1 C4-type zinc ribbon domain-containing protein [Pseudomonadota bacterium]HNN53085.1 C4-type zinc ribbon domain-containing protein [Pseudomonadota bacterium]HNO70104.1 C4-type zinc ribbon domain-containing protein [Pseudomonadota bacterium]